MWSSHSIVVSLVLTVLIGHSTGQDEVKPLAEEGEVVETVEPAELPATDVICKQCACSDTVADCSNRELRKMFEIYDWNGIRNTDITDVDLSKNFFITVPQFPELKIKKLNMSSCEIEIMERATFSFLAELTTLDLSRNKLTFSTIGKLVFLGPRVEGQKPSLFQNMRYLSLAYNDIHSLSQDVFIFMPFLTFLDLSGNPLGFIDQVTMGSLADLTRLKELRLSECDLETLPEGLLRRQRKLERLNLSGNRFSTIPATLSEAVNLLYLNFDKNPILNLTEPTPISSLTNLQELRLSRHSKLRSISAGALGGLQQLVRLHITYNPRLTELDPGFLEWEDDAGVERWPQLEELYLNNNNISSISSKMLDHWSQLINMDFSANPYTCDCTNQWMVDVLVPHILGTVANASISKMICRKPDDYRGMTFAQLYETRKALVCTTSESIEDASSAEMAVLYGILIGILVSFPIVLVIVILWKNGYFAKCRKKMNNKDEFDEEETDAF